MDASAHGETTLTSVCLLVMASLCLACAFHYAFAILPSKAALSGPGIVPDLYPVWYGSRAVLFQHQDPYSPEVTRRIQTAMYQGKRANQNEQRFAYPLFAVVLFAPFAMLPFAAAQTCFFVLAVLLTMWSVVAWLEKSISPVATGICVILVVASFPVMLGLELRQPTMLVATLLAATAACLRSGRLAYAGILGALATAKPQLAIALLLPLLFWAVSDWHQRKSFLLAFSWTLSGLLAMSEGLSHGWLLRWLATIRAYSHYAGAPPLIRVLPGSRLPVLAGALLVGAALAVSWKWKTADPLLAMGFCVSVCQVLLPLQLYNEVILLPAVLWTLMRRSTQTANLQTLTRWSVWGLLGAGWGSTVILCVAELIDPASIAKLWSLPIVIAWVFPIALLAHLAACVSAPLPAGTIGLPAAGPSSGLPVSTCLAYTVRVA